MSPRHISHPSLRNECVTCAGRIPGPMSSGQCRRAASCGVSLWPTASGGVGGENVLSVKRLRPTASGGGQLLQRFIMANGVGRRRASSMRFGGFIVANGVGRRRASPNASGRAGWRWLVVSKTHCYLKPHCRFSGFSIPGRAWRHSGFSVHGSMQILRFLRSVRRRAPGRFSGFSVPSAAGGLVVSPRPAPRGRFSGFSAPGGGAPKRFSRLRGRAPARRSETSETPPGAPGAPKPPDPPAATSTPKPPKQHGAMHSETSVPPGAPLHSETSETAKRFQIAKSLRNHQPPPATSPGCTASEVSKLCQIVLKKK